MKKNLSKQEDIPMESVELYSDKYGTLYYLESKQVLIGVAEVNYIPMEEFKKICFAVENFIKTKFVKKLIFDKRNLTVFHQDSMEWYHVVWKPNIANYGLKTHRKLLPNDNLFRKSVEIGRQKIKQQNPHFNFEDFDIQYAESITEAIEN